FPMLMISVFLFLLTGVDTPRYIVVFATVIPVLLLVVLSAMVFVRSRLLRYLPRSFGNAYLQFHRGALGSFGNLPIFILLGIFAWCAEVARLFFVAEAVGFSIGVSWAIFATLTNTLLSLLPLGGLGVTEFSMAALLSRTVVKSSAGSVVILDRTISYVSVILFGGILFLIRTILSHRNPWQQSISAIDSNLADAE
ncbi:flippase-like domain-containing protein, partial [SAR202 cluster bacterium AD-804-J14_MRT_500m]|nr:flippase-like domain-containing protein [SAR202 cluster bacterium AD-804-J14_MRT_500m]